jgi:hypothetical protein
VRRAAKALPFALLILLGLILLVRNDTAVESRPEQTALSQTTVPAPAVTVEHTLVTADVVKTPILQPRSRSASTATTRAADRRAGASTPRALAKAQDSSLGARTRRVIVGDGRHKPQPFPRVNNN